ncbi:hypothetical protein K5D44_20375 [Pseudomonas cichorii]|nr:hypothetical protein [Pseudomonas cichorii]MBX8540125.1 hypothetical protein [Pseudomonas cichorii]MBX8549646.1 hypothetical protein [Pseudomonas cichorii]MBX8567059.1 hypothetical protein [Pseudomonas cichorii]MBX8579695.1 hypothetical protein [Pseudomonas cichorii]MBX8583714.1 hypothetical protein [Pseudomonas cichorii]
MSKTRAYTSQTGNVQVTAWQVNEQRKKFFNGSPTPYSYFSLGRPGSRIPVKHVSGKNYPYFSYMGAGGGGAASGESLNHLLFKEALCELKRLRLDISLHVGSGIRKRVSVDLKISNAEKEKQIILAEGGFRSADVYYEFESDSWLWRKWGGELYIEVFSANAVGALKQIDVRSVSAPVIEVEIPPIFEYKVPDEETTDEKELKHKEKIKRILSGEKGFLRGRSLSNPSTKEYLIEQVKFYKDRDALFVVEKEKLVAALSDSEQKLAAEVLKVDKIERELSALKERLQSVQSERNMAVSALDAHLASEAELKNARDDSKRLRFPVSMIIILVFIVFMLFTIFTLI